MPSRQYLDSPSISPRYWRTSHTSSPVRRALLYRRPSRDRSCLPVEFYGQAFYICGAASHGKPRTHPARHKQLECIDQGRIQPWRDRGGAVVVAWLSRGREPRERKSPQWPLCFREVHPLYKIKLSFCLPDCFATLFYLLSGMSEPEKYSLSDVNDK